MRHSAVLVAHIGNVNRFDNAANDLIIEVWSGDVSKTDLQQHWTSHLRAPKVMAIRRTVVELRQATITFIGTELSELVDSVVVPVLLGKDWRRMGAHESA